jgi:hypothetical protein
MSTKRKYFFQILTLLLILITIYVSWGLHGEKVASVDDVSESLQGLQSQIGLGISKFESIKSYITIFLGISIISLTSAFIIAYKVITNRIVYRFKVIEHIGDYCLEIFCLYLLGMLLVSSIGGFLLSRGLEFDFLAVNVFAILALSVIAFWPLLFGFSFHTIKKSSWASNS